MRDRQSTPGKEGRVRFNSDNYKPPTLSVDDNGHLVMDYESEQIEGVLEHADDATQEGSVYCKSNVLPDTLCDTLGIDRVESEPKDAFLALLKATGNGSITLRAYAVDGSPYAGIKINGLPIDDSLSYTDENGLLIAYVAAGSYTITSSANGKYIDCEMTEKTLVIAAGQNTMLDWSETAKPVCRASILSSSTVMFSKNVAEIDVFCVGGGGSGAYNTSGSDTAYSGGGGSGYTATGLNVDFEADTEYQAIIGAGAVYSENANQGNKGGTTSLLGVSANGGTGGGYRTGGDGGSGGACPGGKGGSNGSDASGSSYTPGKGQGTTTKPFGDESEEIAYAGGGGAYNAAPGELGGGAYCTDGAANTGGGGGGGGGGGTSATAHGGSGGSGIIIVRWRNVA